MKRVVHRKKLSFRAKSYFFFPNCCIVPKLLIFVGKMKISKKL
ncbi:hypothetical protein HMPREF2141_01847 [Bacteroides uniformis]|nr:hypothetical protein HMPREF2141_01847 [Bacteroides uniformis]